MKTIFPLLLNIALITYNLAIPLVAESKEVNANTTPVIEKKLNGTIIPGIQFFETPLPEVFIELQRQSRKFDPDLSQKGLNILTFRNGDEPFPNVTITLNSMPLGKVIHFIS